MLKKKMAFVDLTNFEDWPMGGMLEYELAILPFLANEYDLDLWGFSVNGKKTKSLILNGKEYLIHIGGNCKIGFRVVPNFWRGRNLYLHKKNFKDKYDLNSSE